MDLSRRFVSFVLQKRLAMNLKSRKAINNMGYIKENQQDDSSGGKKLPLLCAKALDVAVKAYS